MADKMNVVDPCFEHYQIIEKTSPDTLRVIEKITNNYTNSLNSLGPKHDLLKGVVCTSIDAQKAAHDQWNTDINALWTTIKDIPIPDTTEMSIGGSQSGGADCPADFQKIFNYMFLIAASASIAIMSPDIELVANVCMKALQLVFGTIALPILNLLRVIFLFMLQSLVLIVKTLGTFAVQIISNFIKTVYLNIHTIASGAIGIAKVFIYRSLTYCQSFYNKVIDAMPKEQKQEKEDNKIADIIGLENPPTIPSTITNLNAREVGKINESLKAAIKGEIIDPEVNIIITIERDIFMDMLTNFGETYDAIRKQIKFGYTFLKTAYLLLCDNTHEKIKTSIGGLYNTVKLRKSITKALIYAENSVIRAVNGVAGFPSNLQAVIIYNINVLCLKILKIVYPTKSKTDNKRSYEEEETRGRTVYRKNNESKDRSRSRDNVKIFVDVETEVNNFDDTDLVFDLNVEHPVIPKNREEVNRAINNIETNVGELTDNIEYVSIMEDLDRKLQEIIDRSNPPAFMKKGGAKKRRTKKAKKHINKRRYSRKH
jgi:hypothetical protein